MSEKMQETIAQIVSRKRRMADKLESTTQKHGCNDVFYRSMIETFRKEADEIEAANKREVDKLNSVIQATVSRSDAEIDRLRRELSKTRPKKGGDFGQFDAEAMRELAELVAHMNDDGYWNKSASIRALVKKAKDALAAPPRRCVLRLGCST